MNYSVGNGRIEKFRFFCQKILPLVYDDSLSYYEALCKMSNKLNEVIDKTNEMQEAITIVNTEIDKVEKDIRQLYKNDEEFKKDIDDIKDGKYVELYLDSISNWIDKNLIDIIGRSASFIVFGLTDDGYFAAYVPEGWDFITFDTDADYSSPNFGKLILIY